MGAALLPTSFLGTPPRLIHYECSLRARTLPPLHPLFSTDQIIPRNFLPWFSFFVEYTLVYTVFFFRRANSTRDDDYRFFPLSSAPVLPVFEACLTFRRISFFFSSPLAPDRIVFAFLNQFHPPSILNKKHFGPLQMVCSFPFPF